MSEKIYNVAIIGSGPAGLTAAIYAARANLNPVLISGIMEGGQLMITSEVENFPGFPEGIIGPELINKMKEQAKRFETEFISDDVISVDFKSYPKKININGRTILAKALIIATGATARWIGLESEKKLQGKGVSACATCDGFFFKGKEIVVVGGGDTAMEEATFLTKFASKVSLIHRRDQFRASKIMVKRAENNPKIEFILDTVVEDILDINQGKVTGVKLKNVKTGEIYEKTCQGVFMAIGHEPSTKIFKGHLKLDKDGYILLKDRTFTSINGVFAAGDVTDKVYRQGITAAGMGCMAAIDAERYLEAREDLLND